jgi:hypothetical protein
MRAIVTHETLSLPPPVPENILGVTKAKKQIKKEIGTACRSREGAWSSLWRWQSWDWHG